ncbi:MAG: ABC transporter permease [Chloroflexi bacterium]|nr:ABC transporter permease [Chloroflexota bacterium]
MATDTQNRQPQAPRSLRIGGFRRSGDLQELLGLLIMLALIVLVMTSLSAVFLTGRNLNNLLLASTTIGIIAVFTTMLMIGGGLDLSVASTAALCGVVIGALQEPLGLVGAILASLVVGAGVGLLNGFLVTYVGINALITTLGMLSVARGMAFVLSDALTIPVFSVEPEQMDIYTQFANLSEGTVSLPILGEVPFPVVFTVGLFILGIFVLRFTTYGRAMYAIGGNEEASRLAGLPVRRYRMIAFTLSGLSAGVAGMFLTARLYAADPRAAPSVELTVITAVVLGGTSLAGGKGSLLGTLLGVVILSTLLNGLNLQSVSTEYQNIAQGVVLLLAVLIDQVRLGNVDIGIGRVRKWLARR